MTNDTAWRAALQQLVEEDAVGQLRRRDGVMATLGSEDGVVKLDWVEGVARLLADPVQLEKVEAEAAGIQQRGIRHIIWAGMGGSVLTLRVLSDLGFCNGHDAGQVSIYPLDSTDPAALNTIVRKIAATKSLTLPAGTAVSQPAFLRALLDDVMMIGVSMGMTSEEPITHMEWFGELVRKAALPSADHLLVLTFPGSYLDHFAYNRQLLSVPLQLDEGTGTGGRMSAPSTRVFLLPAALAFMTSAPGQLRSVLQRAWDEYHLELATAHPAEHPFVELAAAMSAASRNGVCRLLVSMPEGWQTFVAWLEQLMEESLGKGGKGIVVFGEQTLNHAVSTYQQDGLLHVRVVTKTSPTPGMESFLLTSPSLAGTEPQDRLAALAASFLGWQLSMALYAYLQRIRFAGQPAVENYKARARALRMEPDPLQITSYWRPALRENTLILLPPHGLSRGDVQAHSNPERSNDSAASVFASALQKAAAPGDTPGHPEETSLSYLDVTVNGEAHAETFSMLERHVHTIGNDLLGIPVKLRHAPAAYHSTEQSEMDGPQSLVSLRLVARHTQASLLESYTNTFLHAQAVSTWQAMITVGRPCFLLVVDSTLDDAMNPLAEFFARVEEHLQHA